MKYIFILLFLFTGQAFSAVRGYQSVLSVDVSTDLPTNQVPGQLAYCGSNSSLYKYNGTAWSISGSTSIVGQSLAVYSAFGTGYTITATTQTFNVASTSMTVTITSPGTYLIMASANLVYVGATFAASQFVTMNIFRQNNTPGVIPNTITQGRTRIITTITDNAGFYQTPPIIYTTANSNDVLSFSGSVSVIPSAGSFQGQATYFRVQQIVLDWDRQMVIVNVGDGQIAKTFIYEGQAAVDMMVTLNTANLSVSSLNKRILNKLISDGHLSGSISGTP